MKVRIQAFRPAAGHKASIASHAYYFWQIVRNVQNETTVVHTACCTPQTPYSSVVELRPCNCALVATSQHIAMYRCPMDWGYETALRGLWWRNSACVHLCWVIVRRLFPSASMRDISPFNRSFKSTHAAVMLSNHSPRIPKSTTPLCSMP